MAPDYAAPLAGEEKQIPSYDGGSIATISAGEGPTVVLAHGFGVDRDEWNVVGAMLVDEGFRVVAFDQRGHGRTTAGRDGISSAAMARDYVTVLESYDVRDGVLGTHSMGGFVGIRFLLDHADVARERLRGALLLATFAGDVNRDNAQNRLQIPLIRTGVLPFLVRTDVVGKPFARTIMGKKGNDAMGAAFLTMFRAQDFGPLVPILRAMVEENRYPRLGEIDLPVAIMVGTDDRTTPGFHTDELYAGIAGSTLERIPDVGHMVVWEDPDVVVAALRRLASRD
ncbi:MAG: alpha/beta hydrolase [Candidatus Nanopelagicales bacterium]